MDMIPRNDYGERCQFDAYCKLVLYHEAIDYLREMQRRRDRELSFSDLPQMEMDKLHRAIAQLPEKQRRRLVLYYFGEFTYEQIADMEGCKHPAVMKSVSSALKKLKNFLSGEVTI